MVAAISWIEDLLPNLIAEAVGLIVVYLIIERAIKKSREKESRPLIKRAHQRLTSTYRLLFSSVKLVASATHTHIDEILISRLKLTRSDLENLLDLYGHIFTFKLQTKVSETIDSLEKLTSTLDKVVAGYAGKIPNTVKRQIRDHILSLLQQTKTVLSVLQEDITEIETWMENFQSNR